MWQRERVCVSFKINMHTCVVTCSLGVLCRRAVPTLCLLASFLVSPYSVMFLLSLAFISKWLWCSYVFRLKKKQKKNAAVLDVSRCGNLHIGLPPKAWLSVAFRYGIDSACYVIDRRGRESIINISDSNWELCILHYGPLSWIAWKSMHEMLPSSYSWKADRFGAAAEHSWDQFSDLCMKLSDRFFCMAHDSAASVVLTCWHSSIALVFTGWRW